MRGYFEQFARPTRVINRLSGRSGNRTVLMRWRDGIDNEAHTPRVRSAGHESCGQGSEELHLWTGGGKRQTHTAHRFNDAGADFQEPQLGLFAGLPLSILLGVLLICLGGNRSKRISISHQSALALSKISVRITVPCHMI